MTMHSLAGLIPPMTHKTEPRVEDQANQVAAEEKENYGQEAMMVID